MANAKRPAHPGATAITRPPEPSAAGSKAERAGAVSQRRFFEVFLFVCGMAVMIVELAASRLLAPFFGDSLVVWANLIGIIMLGLTLGYYWGGRYADRHPHVRPLLVVVAVAGVWVGLLPLLSRPLFRLLQAGIFGTPAGLIVLSFFGATLAFLPPVILLGWVSPYVLRLLNRSVEESGQLAGRLYAISTLGSLAGTFLPSLVTIPLLGTTATFAIAAAALILVSAWGWLATLSRPRSSRLFARLPALLVFLVLLGVPGVVGFRLTGPLKPVPGLVAEVETPYQFAQVIQAGDTRYLTVNEGGGIQSLYRPGSPYGTGFYYDYFALLPYLLSLNHSLAERRQALLIGYAGGTVARQLVELPAAYRMQVQAVEIDPALLRLGREYMGGIPPQVSVAVGDGRIWLSADRRRYDLIIVDAYAQEMYIPFQLSTQEFFTEAKKRLSPDGILAINVNATQTGGLLASFYRTLARVFPYVYWSRAGGVMNWLLIGSSKPLTPAGLAERVRRDGPVQLAEVARQLEAGWRSTPPSGRAVLLRDDRAPVELLTDWMIFTYRNPASPPAR
ncbi:MAG: fused MFS/spermidine synthase [Limnochordaceae bacterium]|nr:fused MFS/spermidine synthase [Limnochordaceae bacterium]